MRKNNLNGMRFGRLVVTEEIKERKNGLVMWRCKCDCGEEASCYAKTLKNGGTRSCGCLHRESSMRKVNVLHKKYSKEIGSQKLQGGYVVVKTADGWKKRSIITLESFLGRKLEKNEIAHHCDEVKTNDDIGNLELMLHGEHTRLHNYGRHVKKSTRSKISKAALNRVRIHGHRGQKLTEIDVVEIKKYISSGMNQTKIAGIFNVSKETITAIKKKRIWRLV